MIGKEPFVSSVGATWFKYAEDFRVDALKRRSVASCFNAVYTIECVVLEWHFHEITFDERDVVRQAAFFRVMFCTNNSGISLST